MAKAAFFAPLAIAMALATAGLHGQVPGQPAQTTQDAERASGPASPGAHTGESQGAQGQAEDGANDAQAGAADSPFIYEPSEDISEDLSVSFPVDI